MHIDPAGVAGPHFGLDLRSGGRGGVAIVLAEAQIPHAEARTPEGPQQLMAVVLQGLEPGPWDRPHREHTALQVERTAVGGQLAADDTRPGLPKAGQLPLALPVAAQPLDAGA